MLTKDLLKFKLRAGRVKPVLIAANDAKWKKLAAGMLQVFDHADGRRFAELEQELSEEFGDDPVTAGMRKLLFDRCTQVEDDGEMMKTRWEYLKAAHQLRGEMLESDRKAFQVALAEKLDQPYEQLAGELYSDLPSERPIQGFRAVGPDQLIHRYNNSQVQGLLIRAQEVEVTLRDIDLVTRRAILRSMKFHRLMPRVIEQKRNQLSFNLEGPLTMFQHGNSYGLRLANFFPHLPQLPRWQLKAEVQVKNKRATLSLSEKDGLISHYRPMSGFVPQELTACCEEFNENSKNNGWQISPADELVNLGNGALCFPDLKLTRRNRSVHVELFHKWHRSTLEKRLVALTQSRTQNFAVGIDRSLMKDEKIASLVARLDEGSSNSLIFNQFPTAKVLFSFAKAMT